MQICRFVYARARYHGAFEPSWERRGRRGRMPYVERGRPILLVYDLETQVGREISNACTYVAYCQQSGIKPVLMGRLFISTRPLLLPAMLYFMSNVMAMYSLGYLRSYIFAAIMNLRIVVAAILSVVLLQRDIIGTQWHAIINVSCAATLLCIKNDEPLRGDLIGGESIGIMLALGAASISAAGGVLIEKYLNQPIRPTTSDTTFANTLVPSQRHHSSTAQTSPAPPLQRKSDLSSIELWEQQGVLALFSSGFAVLYIMLLNPSKEQLLEGWTFLTGVILLFQTVQGLLVAITIQRWGIVFRLILGPISICFCILLEGLLFNERVVMREVLCIVMIFVGSTMYLTARMDSRVCTIRQQPEKASESTLE